MLWRMPADLRRERIGMMFIGITPSTGAPRSAPAAAPTHLNGRQLFHGRQMSGGKPAGTRFGGTSGVAEIAENKFYCAVVAPRLHGMPQPPRGRGNCGNPVAGDNGRHCHNNFTHYPRIGNLTFRWCAAKRTSHVPPLDPIRRRFPPSPAMAFAVGESPGCAPGEFVARARPGAGL